MPYLVLRIPPVAGSGGRLRPRKGHTNTRKDDPVWATPASARRISFTRAELRSFTGATLPDLIAEGVRLLFTGINPGLRSVAVQGHFAPRGNRFYPALLRAGITDHLIDASAGLSARDRDYLLGRGVGITSLVARATASANELGPAELAEGARALAERSAGSARAWSPSWGSPPTGPPSESPGGPRAPARGPERLRAMGGAEPQRAQRARVRGRARRRLPRGRAGRRHRPEPVASGAPRLGCSPSAYRGTRTAHCLQGERG